MSMSRFHYSQKQVIDALTQARGLKEPAAKALHCDRHTVTRYIERFPAVRQAYDDAIQATLDLAQSRLVALVERDDWRAIRYLLGTLGRDRENASAMPGWKPEAPWQV